MNDEVGFLRAMLASPEDPTTRLVYADWLDERGDRRADFLRLDTEIERLKREGRFDSDLERRLEELRAGIDPTWIAFVMTLAHPFWVGPTSRDFFDIEPADMPFTDRIGMRGQVVTFEGQFVGPEHREPGLLEDLRFLAELKPSRCAYGAAELPMYPFLCDAVTERWPLSGADTLTALKARHFQSEHIQTLDATTIPYPGYHPYTNNDEIHSDFAGQYLFFNDGADELSGNHGELKRYVMGGQLWYVLLHPTKHDGFADYAILLAVGRSPHGRRLVGVITHQVCHNLCD